MTDVRIFNQTRGFQLKTAHLKILGQLKHYANPGQHLINNDDKGHKATLGTEIIKLLHLLKRLIDLIHLLQGITQS